MKAKGLVSNGQGEFQLQTLDIGDPAIGEVRVKVYAAGLCHTDWDSIQNWNKNFIVGHEGAGVIDMVGPGVDKVKVGDKVILNWAIPCGQCFQCNEGNLHICENNSPVCGNGLCGHAHKKSTQLDGSDIERSFHLGTLCEYAIVKAAAVVKIDVPISFAAASIVGCGVMTGYGSAVNAAKVKAGSSVCVIGCGGVGLNAIQGAKIAGAAKIIAIDINPDKLEMAKTFGATHGIVATKNDIDFQNTAKQVKALTGGRGADYAFECTAIPQLGSAPLALVRNAGTAVQVSGIEESIQFNCELFEWDKKYINPLYGMCNPEKDFLQMLDLFSQGKLLLNELVSKTYTLDNVAEGFDDMLNGRIAKGVVILANDME